MATAVATLLLLLLLATRSLSTSVDDALALVQLQTSAEALAVAHRFRAGLSQAQASSFNCTAAPNFCREPFNCQGPVAKVAANGHGVARADGHANFQLWCAIYPVFSKPVEACAAGKLRDYARLMYDEQKAGSTGPMKPNITSVDAQYCFIFGHCDGKEPLPDGTTLQEMEQMCDERFGHEHWTTKFHMMSGLAKGTLADVFTGKMSTDLRHPMQNIRIGMGFSKAFAELACGMGNYHCDSVYCKEMYCSDPGWKAKYGHLAPEPSI
eukprot:CAMPEP_0171093218 /NCGR_PEP_ID=MMETSP0766_2-20121228/38952_1 /TAXON_ID=439317 /ORGANISM="Gambierdiscus australes, Strain CAWD 149" /LENGTH=266 /DNA_ID=CAMNT_0011551631 /DNA_START=64 /DNA_END=864 /DNA_ORIENTATION=+